MPTRVRDLGNPALFVFDREGGDCTVTCVFNFTESEQRVTPWALKLTPGKDYEDLLSKTPLTLTQGQIVVPPYAALWFRAVE